MKPAVRRSNRAFWSSSSSSITSSFKFQEAPHVWVITGQQIEEFVDGLQRDSGKSGRDWFSQRAQEELDAADEILMTLGIPSEDVQASDVWVTINVLRQLAASTENLPVSVQTSMARAAHHLARYLKRESEAPQV